MMIGEKRTMCQFLLVCFSFVLVSSFVEGAQNITNELEKIVEIRSNLEGRIVNGSEAYLGQFPQQVSLRRDWNDAHFCGGNIIDPKFILTAAHCMFLNGAQIKPGSIKVVAGNVLLQGGSTTQQESDVRNFIIHQSYNDRTLENDIALLELEEPFHLSDVVKVGEIPAEPIRSFTLCQVAGWGYPSDDVKIISNELMFVELPLLSQEKCRELLDEVSSVPDGIICAGYEEGGKDACKGDSGGGFLCNGQLTGIVSGGKGCGDPGFPGLYADVYFQKKWIDSTILRMKLGKSPFYPDEKGSGSSNFPNIFCLVSLLLSTFLRTL